MMRVFLITVAVVCSLACLGSTFEAGRLIWEASRAMQEAQAAEGLEGLAPVLGGTVLHGAAQSYATIAAITLVGLVLSVVSVRALELAEARLKASEAHGRALVALGKLAQSHENKLGYACERLRAIQQLQQRKQGAREA